MSRNVFSLIHPSFYLKFNSVSPLIPAVSCGQLLKEAIAAKSAFGELIQPFFEKRMTGRWTILSTNCLNLVAPGQVLCPPVGIGREM